jgi:hypothetical protein
VPFTAKFIGQTGDDCDYQIEGKNAEKLVRTFTATISRTQQVSAKGWEEKPVERKVELWCKHHSSELPNDGGRICIDLDEVAKD